ncbi:MAG: hypothetical protein MUP97_03320, partial [Acidimicrobiia bacterium]|nr:hypothetical protein [Acidimicrobiia bacterium]
MEIFDPIFEAIGWLLALFYSVIPNFGVAIILLTFTIMLILYPLTAKQAKSMTPSFSSVIDNDAIYHFSPRIIEILRTCPLLPHEF